MSPTHTFADACDQLRELLEGSARRQIVSAVPASTRDPAAFLRAAMRAHHFRTAGGSIALGPLVDSLDAATIADGFHILHVWDPVAHRFRDDGAALLLLKLVRPVVGPNVRRELVLQLDVYFLYLLQLLVMRVWDAPDPDAALDEVSALLEALQGPQGSGRWWVQDAATLLSLAIAQYQPDERGYSDCLARIRMLSGRHQLSIAAVNAANFGAHLRWGSRFMYAQDMTRMRADNVVDYPWVQHAAATLAHAWQAAMVRGGAAAEVTRLAEGLLNVLSPDPGALLDAGPPPAVLASCEVERDGCRTVLLAHRPSLLAAFGALRPVPERFSPLGFHFNFLHNVLTGVLALTLGEPTPNVPLDVLLLGGQGQRRLAESPDVLAHQLTGWASHPSRLDARQSPLMLQDTAWGQACCDRVVEALS